MDAPWVGGLSPRDPRSLSRARSAQPLGAAGSAGGDGAGIGGRGEWPPFPWGPSRPCTWPGLSAPPARRRPARAPGPAAGLLPPRTTWGSFKLGESLQSGRRPLCARGSLGSPAHVCVNNEKRHHQRPHRTPQAGRDSQTPRAARGAPSPCRRLEVSPQTGRRWPSVPQAAEGRSPPPRPTRGGASRGGSSPPHSQVPLVLT